MNPLVVDPPGRLPLGIVAAMVPTGTSGSDIPVLKEVTDRADKAEVSSSGTSTAHTIRHRYPWSAEELLIIAFFLAVPIGLAGWQLLMNHRANVWLLAVPVILGMAIAILLIRLGHKRKVKSQIVATLDGTKLTVDGGRVRHSAGDISEARSVSLTEKGPEEILIIDCGEGSFRIPCRLLADATLTEALRKHLLDTGIPVTPQAKDILERS